MSQTLNVAGISVDNTLFVFALASEAAGEFDDCHKLICGIGKVNAAYELTKAIARHKPELIINVGSAGSNVFERGQIVCCTQFIQRDMDVRGLGYALYETPFSTEPVVLAYGLTIEGIAQGICGTGDNFEMSHMATAYNVVDMEAFALAHVAKKENIPFLCLKYISDGADGGAAEDWTVQVHHAAANFKRLLFPVFKNYL